MKQPYTERLCTAQEIQSLVSKGANGKSIIATNPRHPDGHRNVSLSFASRLKGTIRCRETPWELILVLTKDNLT